MPPARRLQNKSDETHQNRLKKGDPITYGPIDFLALKFPGNKFRGEILPALRELIESKTVHVLDLVLVVKDEQGRVGVREMEQPEPDMVVIFDPSKAEGLGMIKLADMEMIAEQLEPNSSAAATGSDLTTQLQQLGAAP